jgi:Kef-type K+ transport system membrane component KefB
MHPLIDDPFTRFLVQIVAIIAVSRLIGLGARRLGQPMVIAEIIAGIVLGPSLLGWAWPEASTALFAPGSLGLMNAVSELGLVLFMFLIGLELDHHILRGRGSTPVAISYTSILLPFVLGGALSLLLYPSFAGGAVSLTTFALFIGAAMSITAFPVLARILAERRLLRTRVGSITIACAAVDDVTTWCILAFVVAAARASGLGAALTTTALAAVFVVAMMLVVRPLVARLAERPAAPASISHDLLALVLVLLLVSSAISELIGVHALFGAFLFGAILPKRGGFARAVAEKLEDFVIILLVPLFFAYTGLRTEIGLLDSATHWGLCALIIVVATLGKAGGGAIAARVAGLSWREAGALGVLLNTRGLMGLIVLHVGLDLGVISPALFSMMIIMALVTTFIATPLLARIYPLKEMARDLVAGIAASEPPKAPAERRGQRVLACVSSRETGTGLVALARAIRGSEEGGSIELLGLVPATDRQLLLPDEVGATGLEALAPALERARELELSVRPLSFVTPDPADDICRVAAMREPDLVLLEAHPRRATFGRVAAEVMSQVASPVAVLIDRGLDWPRRLLVPFAGSPDDRAALVLALQIGAGAPAAVEVIHLARPGAGAAEAAAFLESAAAGAKAAIEIREVGNRGAAEAVLDRGGGVDLVILGAGEGWGFNGPPLAPAERRLLDDRRFSLLLVRGPTPNGGKR